MNDPHEHDDAKDWGVRIIPAVPTARSPEGAASVDLPGQRQSELFDTGSDAWWQAQAVAFDAAAHEPAVVAEPDVAPEPVDPLDADATDPHGTIPPYVDPAVRPARALPGALIALAGVVLGIVTLLYVGGDHRGSGHGPAAALPRTTAVAPHASAAARAPVLPAPVLPVTVLNNSRVAGLAGQGAARFRAGGWLTVVGNFRGRVERTSVYYAAGQQASAQRFARQFGIGRVAPRFPTLPGEGLTVVLTRDFPH